MSRDGRSTLSRWIVVNVVTAAGSLQRAPGSLQLTNEFPALHTGTSISLLWTLPVIGTVSCSSSIIR